MVFFFGLFPLFFLSVSTIEADATTRIIGGLNQRKEIPFVVHWAFDGEECGGALLDELTVLTAAHCCKGKRGVVVAGELDTRFSSGNEQWVHVKKEILHSEYNHQTWDFDICLLCLETHVRFNNIVGPATVSTKENIIPGTTASVAGWGWISEQGTSSPILKRADVQIKDNAFCTKQYKATEAPYRPDIKICAAARGKDACAGDSGGPLVLKDTANVIGIVSYGNGCGREDFPGIYTRVSTFNEWIDANRRTCNPNYRPLTNVTEPENDDTTDEEKDHSETSRSSASIRKSQLLHCLLSAMFPFLFVMLTHINCWTGPNENGVQFPKKLL